MHSFMVLCLAAVAIAAPQGYNYQQPISSGGHGGHGGFSGGSVGFGGGHGGFSGGGGHGGFSSGGGHGGFSSGGGHGGFSSGGGHGGFSSGGGSGFGGGHGFGGGSGGGFGGGHGHGAPIVSKHFYIHSAPEEHDDESISQTISAGPAHKSYRVVFIKAPSQSSKSAAIQFAQAQNEEKTVIYVLSKKTDASDIQAHVQAAPHVETKPEVFFIKYKTPEEAAHAQHTIQAQYDSLGGTSQVSDEGYAPVTSVIGSLGGGHSGGGHSGGGHSGGHFGGGSIGGGSIGGGFSHGGGHGGATSGTYLPPN